MRALLDVNVLIALLDAAHVHHRAAGEWLAANVAHGWASCPLTQNGCLRILSQPRYPNAVPLAEAAARLGEASRHASHQFWPDEISLLDVGTARWDRLLSGNLLTDAYLLALAVRRGGRLVTFDRAVPLAAIPGATPEHLLSL
ncbi:MAG: PilT protein [Hydrocarboniphaga sp.]|uniref:TA system VapC family ribonuclease toxin n=1 Tax=Hydrocarboniphaga sp. TaxID=2033016 RepID=UPI0026073C47|nr:TA system VapC family ribonuclease toxin [Hydrocarboniphaga sp.]MDB5972917.1 PilT protein [Hydrocarboniphaga sp.]